MMPADASAERHPAKTGGGQVTLGVVSQNLWSTFFSLVGKDRYGRIRSFAEALSRLEQQVDVVLLQEVYVAKLLGGSIILGEDAMEMLKVGLQQKCGLKYFVRSQPNLTLHGTTSDARESERTHWSANRLLQQNGGLVIASRHPIVHSAFHPFGSASLHEAVNWKGMLVADLDVQGVVVRVMNVHLDAGRASGPRSRQYQEIRKQVTADGEHRPHIIAGDFNSCPRSYGSHGARQYNELRTCLSGYESVFDVATPTHRDWRAGAAGGPTLDYIFYEPTLVVAGAHGLLDFRCVADSTAPVSDHLGLHCLLTITQGHPPQPPPGDHTGDLTGGSPSRYGGLPSAPTSQCRIADA